jgi:glycosyltransferase involved in cell wall biosynthesis
MKILHLIPQLSGGGAERQLSILAPEMAKAGHEVHVAYLKQGPENVQIPGVVLHRLKALCGNYDPLLVCQLWKICRLIRPDIVQSWIVLMDILAGTVANLTKILWIIREPSAPQVYSNPTLKLKLRELLTRNATAIISNSFEARAYWQERGVAEGRLFMISNAVPIATILEIEPQHISASARKLISVGRLVSSKNLDVAIKALHKIQQRQNVSLFVAGAGPEKSNLIRLVDCMEMEEKVQFLGHVQSHKLWAYIKATDAFISLSAYEGMPNAVCEAAACETPLILSDIPAHRAIFDEKSAFYVPIDSVGKIAETICQVLKDKQEAAQRAARALEVVKYCSPKLLASKYVNLYKRLSDRVES